MLRALAPAVGDIVVTARRIARAIAADALARPVARRSRRRPPCDACTSRPRRERRSRRHGASRATSSSPDRSSCSASVSADTAADPFEAGPSTRATASRFSGELSRGSAILRRVPVVPASLVRVLVALLLVLCVAAGAQAPGDTAG